MKRSSPLWGSVSVLIGVVIAILALVRGAWLVPLLLLTFTAWGLWVVMFQLQPAWDSIRGYRKKEHDAVVEFGGQVKVKMASPEGLLTKLSGGNQQKVIIARWLAAGCRLLIIDEPTRGIDVVAKDEIHKLLRKCADEGMTVLAVSSEMEELINICNRILIMHEGRQKAVVSAENITPEEILNIALSESK